MNIYQPNHYLAFELTNKSRSYLLSLFPPKFSKIIAHHVTIDFNLNQEKFIEYRKKLSQNAKVIVYGYAYGDGIECLAVAIDNEVIRSDDSFYHVTLSLEPPHKPVESNNLKNNIVSIKSLFRNIKAFELEGTFKLLKK